MCRFAGDLYIGLVFWVTDPVTLVVQSVRYGVGSANAYVLKGDLPAPRDNYIVDINGVVPRPEDPLIYPQETAFIDQGFHNSLYMPDRKAGNPSKTLIGDPGML